MPDRLPMTLWIHDWTGQEDYLAEGMDGHAYVERTDDDEVLIALRHPHDDDDMVWAYLKTQVAVQLAGLVLTEATKPWSPEDAKSEQLWRCEGCGAWSHAKRAPRRHRKSGQYGETCDGPFVAWEARRA